MKLLVVEDEIKLNRELDYLKPNEHGVEKDHHIGGSARELALAPVDLGASTPISGVPAMGH